MSWGRAVHSEAGIEGYQNQVTPPGTLLSDQELTKN